MFSEYVVMRKNLFWIVLGVLSAYLLYLMVFPFIDVLVYSVFVYYVGRPLYKRLERRLRSHSVSAFITLFLLLLPVTVVVVYGLGVASIELLNFMRAMDIPYAQAINKVVADYSAVASEVKPGQLFDMFMKDQNLKGAWDISTGILLSAMGIIFRLMLMFTIALYLMMDGGHLRDWAVRTIHPEKSEMAERFFNDVDRDLHGVFFGSILTALFIAVMGALVFGGLNNIAPAMMKIPYTMLLGMVCGIVSLVPAVGVALFWVPATLVLAANAYVNGVLFTQGWFVLVFAASTAVLVDWGPNLLFKPRVSGKNIHPGLMMMAYLLGPIAFGLAGLFIGPIVLVVFLNFARTVLPELRRGD